MGTNYYTVKVYRCEACGHGIVSDDKERHIGKSSAGWCFSLRVYPEDDINTLDDWKVILKRSCIQDEYGSTIPYEEMFKIITQRSSPNTFDKPPCGVTPSITWEEFHRSNQSQFGPNGLLRHRTGDHCVGHGEGTWDYLEGEFC